MAELGSFELKFGKTVVLSLLLSSCSDFVDSWKTSFPYSRIPETETSTARHHPCQQKPPKNRFLILGFLRQETSTARHHPCQQMPQKNADKSANYRFATLVTVGIPIYHPPYVIPLVTFLVRD